MVDRQFLHFKGLAAFFLVRLVRTVDDAVADLSVHDAKLFVRAFPLEWREARTGAWHARRGSSGRIGAIKLIGTIAAVWLSIAYVSDKPGAAFETVIACRRACMCAFWRLSD